MDCKFVTKPSDYWKKPTVNDVMAETASIRKIQDDIQKRLDESQDEFVQWINGWSKTTGIPVFSLMKYVHKSHNTLFANEDKNKYVTENVATYELDLEKLVADIAAQQGML